MTTHVHPDAAPAAASPGPASCLWLDAGQLDQVLAALAVAVDRTDHDLGCPACSEGRCTDPGHAGPAAVRQWRTLAQQLAVLRTGTPFRAVAYDPDAARDWLTDWAAEEFGIDESFSTVELTIVAELEDLLRALAWNTEPDVWTTREPLQCVQLWRTADGDGVDGGAMITADLRFGEHTVRLGTRHQEFDDFVDDETTSGLDAAVEALGHIADLVNTEVARLLAATAVRPPATYTVIGVWSGGEPIPVGAIAGEHTVHHGDRAAFAQGLWATSVVAADSTTAQQLAVDQIRRSRP